VSDNEKKSGGTSPFAYFINKQLFAEVIEQRRNHEAMLRTDTVMALDGTMTIHETPESLFRELSEDERVMVVAFADQLAPYYEELHPEYTHDEWAGFIVYMVALGWVVRDELTNPYAGDSDSEGVLIGF
jgi:hypothetical protein